jgi:hypothetical protein
VVTNLTGTASININGTVGATTPNTGNFTVLTENASPVVVQTDIGTAPNEIPLNQYLGNLAYQDAANIAGPVGVGGALTVVGNIQVLTNAIVQWQPTPASIGSAATLTNADIQGQIINTTGLTYTVTMPLGTTMETLVSWGAVNLGYDFSVINTATGIITMAVNTGVTSVGSLIVAIGASARFRVRRTAANTFILYRLS